MSIQHYALAVWLTIGMSDDYLVDDSIIEGGRVGSASRDRP